MKYTIIYRSDILYKLNRPYLSQSRRVLLNHAELPNEEFFDLYY